MPPPPDVSDRSDVSDKSDEKASGAVADADTAVGLEDDGALGVGVAGGEGLLAGCGGVVEVGGAGPGVQRAAEVNSSTG